MRAYDNSQHPLRLSMVNKKIDAFFKKSCPENNKRPHVEPSSSIVPPYFPESSTCVEKDTPLNQPAKIPRLNSNSEDVMVNYECDLGKRKSIWDYPVNQRDEVRRFYLREKAYQLIPLVSTEHSDKKKHQFLPSWYKLFPDWLEYSPTTNRAYCLPCFLFTKPSNRSGQNAFTIDGFQSWKKVNDGNNCAFLGHLGKDPNSSHKKALRCCEDLLKSAQYVDKFIKKQSSDQIARNRLQLKASIDVVKYLAVQGCAFRGHDETSNSSNRGNFLELLQLIASYNDNVAAVVLGNAPSYASYVSHGIQKKILSIFAEKIQRFIREEIDEAKFCIIIDEARDESKREQMAIVLRFVDKKVYKIFKDKGMTVQ